MDISLLENNNELIVNGILMWSGEKNNYVSEVLIIVSSNIVVINVIIGKVMKFVDIKEEDIVRVVFL